MGSGISIDEITRKETPFAVENQLQLSGAPRVTSLVELFSVTKYIFVTEFFPKRMMKGEDWNLIRMNFLPSLLKVV
jgi:hypothetical protein